MVVLTYFNGKWWFWPCFQRWPWAAIKCEKLEKTFWTILWVSPRQKCWLKNNQKGAFSPVKWSTKCRYLNWLVVSTALNNISQLGWLFPMYGKIKNVPNHQPVKVSFRFEPTKRISLTGKELEISGKHSFFSEIEMVSQHLNTFVSIKTGGFGNLKTIVDPRMWILSQGTRHAQEQLTGNLPMSSFGCRTAGTVVAHRVPGTGRSEGTPDTTHPGHEFLRYWGSMHVGNNGDHIFWIPWNICCPTGSQTIQFMPKDSRYQSSLFQTIEVSHLQSIFPSELNLHW